METVIVSFVVGLVIGLVIGLGNGIKIGMKRVIDVLHIPEGHRIESVSYRRIE